MNENHRIQSIVEGCKKKSLNAQHDLYRAYYSYGMSICVRYVNDKSEAISILNDGFMKVYRFIENYDSSRPFKPWLRKILVNTAINHIKKQQKFKYEILMEKPKEMSVSDVIISKLGYDDIMKAVQSLSIMYRTVFNMYVIDGYRHDEISSKLGISVNTSKSNLSRAKSNLRDILNEKLVLNG